jgi:hypothetical protein
MNKKLLTLAVGSAMSLGMGLQPAQASHQHFILFPYVVKDTNRTTVVTVIGYGQPAKDGPSLHLQYWTKDTTAANTAACQPSSTTMTFTDDDIATWDTAGLLGVGALFGDTTNAAPLGTSISYAAPRHGYLLVESLNVGDGGANMEGGYWMELDLANGGAHGDAAIRSESGNNSDIGDFSIFNGWISAGAAHLPAGYDNNANFEYRRAVPFWPSSVASSAFTVTPLGSAMLTSDNNSVVMQVFNNSAQGAYDRNENAVDGTVPQTVRCVGRLTAAQLMPGVVANAAWAATGGWGFLTNLGDNNSTTGQVTDLAAAVYQVDTSSAAGSGKFLSNATRIASDLGGEYTNTFAP